jgi:hypothetical protein
MPVAAQNRITRSCAVNGVVTFAMATPAASSWRTPPLLPRESLCDLKLQISTSNRSMDQLTAFGLLAVTAMLIFYALEDRSPWFILAFAGACALASIYGFLQGAWPFGVIEAIWAGVAIRRWRSRAAPAHRTV